MRARILAIASIVFLYAAASPAAGQTGDAKKKDASPKQEIGDISAESEIAGKNLEQWIKLIANKDRSQTKNAIEAIVLYGPELAQRAVPAMVAELNKHNPPYASLDMSVRTTIPQPMALILASVKSPNAKDVKDAVGAFKRMLKDPQVIVKHRVTQAVQMMGPMAKDTVPELAHLVTDSSSETWELREAAVVALGTVAFEDKAPLQPKAAPALFAGLRDPTFKVRLAAIQSLNTLQIGQDAAFKQKLAAEMHKMADKDLDPSCKLRANLTIYTTLEKATDKKKQREIISKFLDHKEQYVRREAVQALGLIGEEAKDQVPHLLKSLNDTDLSIVALSVVSLAHIKDKSALPQLQKLMDNAAMPEVVRATARDAIEVLSGLNSKKEEPKKGAGKQ